jgi:SAM-dependent methyltransferase
MLSTIFNWILSKMTPQTTYSLFAKFYDAYVGDYNLDLPLYSALAAKTQSPILEIGCGSGRVLFSLLQTGQEVTGVDISEEMLRLAEDKLQKNQQRGRCKLVNHNFVDHALPHAYGLALVTFYTFNYLLSPDDQKAFLNHVAESLLPGSVIVFHLFYPHTLSHPETSGKWIDKGQYRVAGETIFLQDFRRMSNEHLEERIQAFRYKTGHREEIHTLRRYVSPGEIYRLLIDAGFAAPVLINNFDLRSLTLLQPDLETNGDFVVMAEKQGEERKWRRKT